LCVCERDNSIVVDRFRRNFSLREELITYENESFLPRDTMRKCGLCCGLCLSICLSDYHITFVHSIHKAEDIVKLLSQPGSPIILVFCPPAPAPIPRGTLSVGVQNTMGVRKFCDFCLNSLSISETVRDRPIVAMER